MAQLPDDYKQHEGLSKFKTIGELAAAYLEKGEQPPRAGPEEPGEESIPDSFEDYELQVPEMPEELAGEAYDKYRKDLGTYLKSSTGEIKAIAHELGLTNAKAQRIASYFAEKQYQVTQAAIDQEAGQRSDAEQLLKREWKSKYDVNCEISRRAIVAFGGQELIDEVEALGLGNHPLLIKAFFRVGNEISEGFAVPGSTAPSEPTKQEDKIGKLIERYPSMAKDY